MKMLGIIVFLAFFSPIMGQKCDGFVPVSLVADMGDFKIKKIEGGHMVEEFHHTAPTFEQAVTQFCNDLDPFFKTPKSFKCPLLLTYKMTHDVAGKPRFIGDATADVFLTDSSMKGKPHGVRRIFKETIIYSVTVPPTADIEGTLRIASKLFKDLSSRGFKFDVPNVHYISYFNKRNEMFVIKNE